ncbi:site-specific integrase [Vibrio wakamikoensis]|uniref:site-specific integrase n=1 Tax=Vibrio wakamikoensis TaxID=2910251 RepID=UPI003D1DE027
MKKTLVRHYKLMLEARNSLEYFDFSRFSRVLKALRQNAAESSTEVAPDECFEEFEQHPPLKNIAVDIPADIASSKAHERESNTATVSASEVDIRWYCEQYQTHRNNKLGVRKNSEGVALEAQKTIEMCLLVHELIGVHDITQINVTHADHALSQLRQFPKVSNSKTNKKRFHAFPKHQWVKINQCAGLEVISESTVGRYIEKTSTIYSWIRDNFPVQSINPFCGLASKSGGSVLDEEDNVASFSKNDLVKIFSQPIFTEHKIKRHYTKRIPKYSQYWMPLIALLSGMRPNEIAQLKRKDCVLRDGILFFQLSNQDEDQSLKNKRARRAVPVHSKLIELGFERFIEPLASEERLFSELSYSKKEGYYKSFGEWFKRYFSDYIDLAREGKRFYSFRHTFIDQFKQRGSIAAVPASIVGHKNGNITYDTYGSKADLATLRNYIETVKFDEVLKKVKPLM